MSEARESNNGMNDLRKELRILWIPACAVILFVTGSLIFACHRISISSIVSSILVRTGETPVFTKADRTDSSKKFAPKEKLSKKAAGSAVRRKAGQIQSATASEAPLFALDSGTGKVMADSCFRNWRIACPQAPGSSGEQPRIYTFTALNGDIEPGRAVPGLRDREPAEFLLEIRVRTDRAVAGAKLLLVFNGELSASVDGREVWKSSSGKNEVFNRKKPFTAVLDLPEGETRIQLNSRGANGKGRRLNVRMTDRDDAPLYFTLQSGK